MSGGDAELDALRSDLRVGLGRSFFGDDDGVGPDSSSMRIEFGATVGRYLGEQHLSRISVFAFGLASRTFTTRMRLSRSALGMAVISFVVSVASLGGVR